VSRPDQPLVAGSAVVPADELRWRFGPSGGPGGQHANRAASRAELSIDVSGSPSLPDDLKERLLARLGSRAPGGVVTVTADESRSQWRNRVIARRRMAELLAGALREPRRRIATRPSAAARRRRLRSKRHRAEVKRLRRPPGADD
jgi:ribosome-associated protein